MKPGGYIERRTRIKQKRDTQRRSGRVLDDPFLAFVRTLPCCGCGRRPPSDPHHAGLDKGGSRKANDNTSIPMCRRCHQAIERYQEPFKWPKARRHAWVLERIAETQAAFRAFTERAVALLSGVEEFPW